MRADRSYKYAVAAAPPVAHQCVSIWLHHRLRISDDKNPPDQTKIFGIKNEFFSKILTHFKSFRYLSLSHNNGRIKDRGAWKHGEYTVFRFEFISSAQVVHANLPASTHEIRNAKEKNIAESRTCNGSYSSLPMANGMIFLASK
jgi:hypothetical protein